MEHSLGGTEGKLLLRCARHWVDRQPAASSEQGNLGAVDWQRLFSLASRHGVTPFVSQLFLRGDELPEPYRAQLKKESIDRARHSLGLTVELLRVLRLFEDKSIPALAFKGPTLSYSLYGDVALREFGDLDILVRKQDSLKATELLVAHGYRTDFPAHTAKRTAYLRARYELHFTGPRGSPLIEIHQAFLPPCYSFPFDYKSLWQRLEKTEFCGSEIVALAPGDLLLMLCAHGAKHSWARLAWICDVARLLVVSGNRLDWCEIMDRALALGAKRILLLGVALAGRLLGAPVPAEVLKSAEGDASVVRITQRVEGSLFLSERADGAMQDLLFFLRARERFGDKLSCCAKLAFAPNEEDHSVLSLPSLLSPLYYPLHAVRVLGKYGLDSLSAAVYRA